jgi:hypothetical protein
LLLLVFLVFLLQAELVLLLLLELIILLGPGGVGDRLVLRVGS